MEEKTEETPAPQTGEFDFVHNRLAPMIWALCFDLARENKTSDRLNAVLNSLLTSTCSFVVALTPEGEVASPEHAKAITVKFEENLAAMLADHETVRDDVSKMGNGGGRNLLLNHQNNVLAKAVQELVLALNSNQNGPPPLKLV